MCGAIPPLPQYAFIAWCSVKSTRITLHFTLWMGGWVFFRAGRESKIGRPIHSLLTVLTELAWLLVNSFNEELGNFEEKSQNSIA